MSQRRTKIGQKKHDTEVLKWVKKKEKEGYKIEADLPNYNKPPLINGGIPDAIAKKGNEEKLLEVETEDTLSQDIEQRRNFRKWSNQRKNRSFFVNVVKKK